MRKLSQKAIDATLQYFKEVDARRAQKPTLNNYAKDNRKHGGGAKPFRHVPPHLRDTAWAEYNRLYDKAVREGKAITQQKIGSMMANAAYIAIYARGSRRYTNWMHRWQIRTYLFKCYLHQTMAPPEARRDPKDARTTFDLTGV
jgi:hypothetical protein